MAELEHPVLHFLATLAERGTTDDEHLRLPADLSDWIVRAGLLTERPRVTTTQLTEARQLREAMWRAIGALIDNEPPAEGDRKKINASVRPSPPRAELRSDGQVTRLGGVEAVLSALADDCIALHDGPDRAVLKRCDGPRCTRFFVDRSRGTRRRWCDMKGCGDRAKAAAYRGRRSEQTLS